MSNENRATTATTKQSFGSRARYGMMIKKNDSLRNSSNDWLQQNVEREEDDNSQKFDENSEYFNQFAKDN